MMIRQFALVLALAIPTMSQAALDLDVGSKIKLSRQPGGSGGVNGGRFGVTGKLSDNTTNIEYFETFCAEREERIALGNNYTYTVVAISTVSSTGGQLTEKAAWAYTQFRNGTLAGFDYSNSGTAANDSANALQHIVWEGITGVGTQGTLSVAAQALKTAWLTAFENAVNNSEWTSLGYVRIMHLVDAYGEGVQDQLVLMVPEASSLIVWGLLGAFGSLGTWRLRRK